MDSFDINDSFDLYDPDYGEDTFVTDDEDDFPDLDDDESIVGSEDCADEGGVPGHLSTLQDLGDNAWTVSRPSTIRLYQEAVDLGVLCIHTKCAQRRACAEEQSCTLEDTFLGGEPCSPHIAPPPTLVAQTGGCNTLQWVWLRTTPIILPSLHNLTLWVWCAKIAILPDEDLGLIYHRAWNLFCVTLSFPRMREAFETFCATPVTSPEVARFHLPWIGPFGPPPPAHVSSSFGEWRPEDTTMSCDDCIDVNSLAVKAMHAALSGAQHRVGA